MREYQDVFSKFDGDVDRAKMVEHSILLEEGARPMRQPPYRLGPQKVAEADRQVQELLEKGLIKPANRAWSSPVVMVWKKDGGDGGFASTVGDSMLLHNRMHTPFPG